MKVKRNTSIKENLFKIARYQNGYFTSSQAKKAGYKYRNFGYYLSRKHWIREEQGVYKLSNYPSSDDEQYTLYSLWAGEKDDVPIAVYSHLTALSFYEISEVIPQKLHLTVPKTFRTTKKIPKILKLYKENLAEKDIAYLSGYAMTKPAKTLLDLAQANLMEVGHLAQSISEALDKGLVSKDYILDNQSFYHIIPYLKSIFK